MDIETYNQIYTSLNSIEDVRFISSEYGEPVGVILTIFNQKIVSRVKRIHPCVNKKRRIHLKQWKAGKSILSIANNNHLPASLMASMILKEMGHPAKKILKNPQQISDRRLRNEIVNALDTDCFFSPKAHRMHDIRGRTGELLLEKWLGIKKVRFLTEEDLKRKGASKTPDFLLENALEIDGNMISWIESKALFGSDKEHSSHHHRQLRHYQSRYGKGMVVYWYGFLDSIDNGRHVVKDHSYFKEIEDDIEDFLDMAVDC